MEGALSPQVLKTYVFGRKHVLEQLPSNLGSFMVKIINDFHFDDNTHKSFPKLLVAREVDLLIDLLIINYYQIYKINKFN